MFGNLLFNRFVKSSIFFVLMLFFGNTVFAELTPTIHSTENGGAWNNPATWVEGRVPLESDVVEVNGNVTVYNPFSIEEIQIGSGSIVDIKNNGNYIFNNGFYNNGNILGEATFYVHGKLYNNGSIFRAIQFFSYGEIENGNNVSWQTNQVYVTGDTLQRRINLNGKFGPILSYLKDIEHVGDYESLSYILANGQNLYFDGTKNIYIRDIEGNAIISPIDGTQSGAILGIGILNNRSDINFNTIQVHNQLKESIDKESIQYILGGKHSYNNSILVENDIKGNVNVGSGSIVNLAVRGKKIIGNLVNNGVIKSNMSFNTLTVEGNLINNGTIEKNVSFKVFGHIVNSGTINDSVSIMWDQINEYIKFGLKFNNIEEIEINYSREYKLPSEYLLTNSNKKWKVRGIASLGGSEYTEEKCINVPGCIEGTNFDVVDYSDPISANQNSQSSDNTFINQTNLVCTTPPAVYSCEVVSDNQNKQESNSQTVINNESNAGDPVSLNTGAFTYDNTLMSYAGQGLPFEFKINYSNQAYYNGPLGNNFDFNYNLKLVEDVDGNMNFHNGRLGITRFFKNENGYSNDINTQSVLTSSGGLFTVTQNNSMIYRFNSDNKVVSISDRNDNTMHFEYNDTGALIKIIDSLGREYTLDYYDHSRLQKLTDFKGDSAAFSYFDNTSASGSLHDLEKITLSKGGSGREISFTYTKSDEFVDAHNIIDLIDSKNNIYVTNTYDENDRTIAQKYGEGTISYDYTLTGSTVLSNTVTDKRGNVTVYNYDAKGNTLEKLVQSPNGDQSYRFEYDDSSNLITEIFPLGNGNKNSYDDRNNLIEKRQKIDISAEDSNDDIVTKYSYDSVYNKVIQIISPNGLTTDLELDENGNTITSTTQAAGIESIITLYSYDTLGNMVSKTDPNGNTTTYEYLDGRIAKINKPDDISISYNYDVTGNITSIIDGEGNTTLMSYDDFNLMKQLSTPEGIVSNYEYDALNLKTKESIILSDTQKVETDYLYNLLDQPTQISRDIDTLRKQTQISKYDSDNRVIQTVASNGLVSDFEYDIFSNITKKVVKSDDRDIITLYSYDDNNRLIEQTDAREHTTTFEYDLYDRVIKQTDAQGTQTLFNYDVVGNIIFQKVVDSNGVIFTQTENSYDLLSRMIEKRSGLESDMITEKYEYDPVGNITQQIDPKNIAVRFEYDSNNRQQKVIDALGNTTENIYNKNDKVIKTTVTSADNRTFVTQYEYDRDNRLVKTINNLGETELYSYNKLNQVISKTDKDGGITNYSYDYRGKVLTETHSDKTLSYSYDISGNMTELLDANGNKTLYNYDNLNRLVSKVYPDGNTMTYTYDLLGNIVSTTDPNGTVTNNSYDSLNRLTQRTITPADGVIGVTQENYSYDALGRIISATDSDGNDLSFNYDSLNRLTSETNGGKSFDYSYDAQSNRTAISYGSGSINYTFDDFARLVSVDKNDSDVADYTYDSLNLIEKRYANNKSTSYAYDELLRLKDLTNTQDFDYSYNAQGNITSNGSDNYTYDVLDRISQADYSNKLIKKSQESFSYDPMGNREYTDKEFIKNTKKGKKPIYKPFKYEVNNLNQYLNIEKLSIPKPPSFPGDQGNQNNSGTGEVIVEMEGKLLYDANGNLIGNMLNNNRQYVYSYDYKNRLVKIEKNIYKKKKQIRLEKIVEIKYDILGRRIEKKFNNGSYRKYYYSNQDIIIEENYSKKDKLKNSKEFTYGTAIDDVLSMDIVEHKTRKIKEEYVNSKGRTKTRTIKEKYIETSQYYYHKNHLGSIIAITDETGSIVEEYAYDVFGKPYTKQTDGTITRLKKSKVGNTRMYTGREYDRGLKLYYNRARYYNPQLGRFISRDPIDIADDVNLYAYVGNNSVMFVDRMGTEKTLIIGFLGRESSNSGGGVGLNHSTSGILDILSFRSGINTVKAYKSDHFGGSINASHTYILNNKEKYNKIIILGHSLGGDNAVNLANKLDQSNIEVNLLVTLDIKSFYENDNIKSNTLVAYNYFQTNDILKGEDLEMANYNTTTTIYNKEINNIGGATITHQNIDNKLVNQIVDLIKNN